MNDANILEARPRLVAVLQKEMFRLGVEEGYALAQDRSAKVLAAAQAQHAADRHRLETALATSRQEHDNLNKALQACHHSINDVLGQSTEGIRLRVQQLCAELKRLKAARRKKTKAKS